MNKYMEVENTQNMFISGFPSFKLHYYLERLIIDKEEEILSLRLIVMITNQPGEGNKLPGKKQFESKEGQSRN